MNIKTKVRKVGNSQGILLPKEAIQLLQVKEGDAIYLTNAPYNALRISTADPEFERKMAIADDLTNRYQNALRELAK